LPAAPIIDQPTRSSVIQFTPAQVQIVPEISVPDVPVDRSNTMTEDELCMEAMEEFEDTG